jgi:hypothetical protein
LYTPQYPVQADFNLYYTASIKGTGSSQADLAIEIQQDGVTIGQAALGRISVPFDTQFSGSLVIPNSYLSANSNYRVVLAEVGAGVLTNITASFNSATTWTATVDNLYAQSTYYLDPTVYTQQNFPGNINQYSDYNAIYNNVYSNRVSNLYYDVDYSSNALNPVNFLTIISQSAIYSQVQDSNYATGSSWTQGRYEGTKLTSATYNTYTDGDTSYGATAVIDRYRDYFLYFKNIEAAGLMGGISGGNVRGVALIGIDGTAINLTPDNYNAGLVQQLFGTFDTVQLVTPTNYLGTDYSTQTLTVYIAGGYDASVIIPPSPSIPFPYSLNETNILIVNALPSGSTTIFTDTPGYLLPANYNKAYANKVVELATQAGFPIN